MRRNPRKILAVLLAAAIAFSSVPKASVEASSFVEDIAKILSSDEEEINYVKNASPEAYPTISFGEAFDEFFANPRWTSFISDDESHVVEFKGDCLYVEQRVTARIQYTLDLDNGTFEPTYVGLNNVSMSMLMYVALVEAAFEKVSSGNDLPDETLHEFTSEYLIEGGDSRYITEEDIGFMDSETLKLAKNEFYARHGRKFTTKSIQEYFDQQPWYNGTVEPEDFTDDVFNEYERANIDFIVAHENAAAAESETLESDYLIEGGDSRYITEEDICFMDSETLELAKNEFYARHGRKFVTESIQEYFNQQPWYNGTVEPEDFTDEVFNEYERANIDFIVSYENAAGSGDGSAQNTQGAYDFVVGRTFHLLNSQRAVEFTDSGEFIIIGYYGSSPLMNKYCTYWFESEDTLNIDGEGYGFSYGDGMIYLNGNGEFVGSYELI